ncbi:MAG: phosphonate C-P lyase system protein PhnG [Desulfocurvibacter africanus]
MHNEIDEQEQRRHWMGILAKAAEAELEAMWQAHAPKPEYTFARPPEVGLAMVQARAGKGGQRFHLGEMTMTRCAVRLRGGILGCSYVAGRRPRLAELAAVLDGLLQDAALRPALMREIIDPLEQARKVDRDKLAARTAGTKVDFFTMTRGED